MKLSSNTSWKFKFTNWCPLYIKVPTVHPILCGTYLLFSKNSFLFSTFNDKVFEKLSTFASVISKFNFLLYSSTNWLPSKYSNVTSLGNCICDSISSLFSLKNPNKALKKPLWSSNSIVDTLLSSFVSSICPWTSTRTIYRTASSGFSSLNHTFQPSCIFIALSPKKFPIDSPFSFSQ